MLKRTLTCQKPHGDGKFIPVSSVFCKGAVRPPVTEPCNTDVLCKRKNILDNNNNTLLLLFTLRIKHISIALGTGILVFPHFYKILYISCNGTFILSLKLC